MNNLPPEKPPEQNDVLNEHVQPLESHRFFYLIDAILKRPAAVVHGLLHKKAIAIPLILLTLLIACYAAIGLMMGSFSGGAQLWTAPIKIVLGTLASAAICIPSLYIFLCLSGANQSFPDTVKMLMLSLTLPGILFVGFMPVAWIFSQATESIIFMGILYLLIWSIGLFFGLRLMKNSFRFVNRKSTGTLRLWMFIFALVLLQMSTTLRPIIGKYDDLQFNEKKFFLVHWGEVLDQ